MSITETTETSKQALKPPVTEEEIQILAEPVVISAAPEERSALREIQTDELIQVAERATKKKKREEETVRVAAKKVCANSF